MSAAEPAPRPEPVGNFAQMFTPKLATVLREGYGAAQLRADAVAGLTVAVVALPLSMAIAIASGMSPAAGLHTAIVGGFLVSALGGSRFQIGGPAGAFIVLVSGTVAQHGVEGLVLATFLSGLMLAALGFMRLGGYIKFIPYPVTVGFTAGIAVIIFASQLRSLLGLTLSGPEPGPLTEKLPALWAAAPTVNAAAVAMAAGTVAVIVGMRRWRPHWPGMLAAVALAGLVAALTGAPVETIGSAFGGVPSSLPAPALPRFEPALALAVLPNAVAFTLLGAIESLLSAVVADGMTGRRHRSNAELVAQGAANVGAALFGGFCVTGTIARTATNVRAGAHGPVAGMLHAAFLLAFVLLAAPLAAFIPLAALAGVLAVVAWNMVEREAAVTLLRANRGDAAVLAVTFLLTIFRDLTEAIVVGFALGGLLFIHRMSQAAAVEPAGVLATEDVPDATEGRDAYAAQSRGGPIVYRVRGALFFGAAASIGAVLDRIGDEAGALALDLTETPFIDSSGAALIEGLARKTARRGASLTLRVRAETARELAAFGLRAPLVRVEIA
ncbi:SulP family inorganic anion transporter [Rubrimonas cliftonensis]|uniref:Sulfate permease, SulP family n=1 Tax=Rubrimonas cliftonensis TaxID=89524 RepID=A0A1H3VS67_9RHOB|nr:SulP family inorganic anion transporter [Rubrimonas cliftonensis]SDZ77084.1 sulfate permease, SulP family [Rubrimonas cliftonensis]